MKFGQNLPRNQVPEWASYYINYKGLKKLIKAAAHDAQEESKVDLAEFFYNLDRNLEDVDNFYNKKSAECTRRLKLLHDRYGNTTKVPDSLDRDEVEDLMGALLELRAQLRKLQWYGEVNRRGFYKITKKLDKKVQNRATKERYLATKVDTKAFASNFRVADETRKINEWLEALGEAKIIDDNSSVASAGSMRTVSSRAILNLPSGLLDTVDQAIRSDDNSVLLELLLEANTGEGETKPAYQKLLLNLLQRSISCKSKRCIDSLLQQIDSLEEEDDLNQRNCLHRLVISIGRAKKTAAEFEAGAVTPETNTKKTYFVPAETPSIGSTTAKGSRLLDKADESVRLIAFVLDKLNAKQRPALVAKDSYGRIPLHYAAQYGFVAICQEVMTHMQAWAQYDVSEGIDGPNWQDEEGFAPLHLAVINGHPLATETLLASENWDSNKTLNIKAKGRSAKSGSVLALATKANFIAIVKTLVEAGVDVNYQDEQGETALHIAARFDLPDCAKALIASSSSQTIDIDHPERMFAWTPLFVACVDGHADVAEVLIEAGADVNRVDSSGWTAKEHAALRGHMEIALRLAPLTTLVTSAPPTQERPELLTNPSTKGSSLEDRKSNGLTREVSPPAPVKTFGHRYLEHETMVLVSLGSMDLKKAMNPVKLDAISLNDAHATHLDTALSVVVSATGAVGEPTVIDLPVQENISTEPITFMTGDITKVKLLFDIVPTYSGSKDKIVGRGAAILANMRPSIGSKRISLQGDVSVPVIAAATLDVIGTVQFNFLVITPFSHPNMSISERHTYWKKMAEPQVIGHRGLGKNMNTKRSLQLGENTIDSFIAAANLGASYVEFDVQLTKDLVPVIYHDFLVSETGIDAPVHTLTLEQFLHVSSSQTPHHSRPASPSRRADETGSAQPSDNTGSRRPRSYSLSASSESGLQKNLPDMTDKMKHTRTFKERGWKANTRGSFIQAPFTTLEQMFKQLPTSIGFNIEMKYPMLDEAEEHEMDTYAVELNSFVDTVLTKVYDLGGTRNIIFSSFNPDLCLLLSLKQPSIPVLFLTDAGTSKTRDIRASSLQEAIRFASRWNLLGIVSAAPPLVMCPRLVRVVKESGLVCVSYGTLNNEPKHVQTQVNEGIDAVIVDSVLAIRQGLTAASKSPPQTPGTKPEGPAAGLPLLQVTSPSTISGTTSSRPAGPIRGLSAPNVPTTNGAASRASQLDPDIVDMINGVPVYRNGGAASGAVF